MTGRPSDPDDIGRIARPERLVTDVDEELTFHVEGRVEELVAEGWREDDARAEVLRRFGDVARYSFECRGIANDRIIRERRGEMMGNLIQDIRFALRSFRRSPGFAVVAVLTLALGVGATTAVFTVAKNVVFDPLPLERPEELVMVWERNASQNIPRDRPSPPNYTDWRHQNRSFVDLAAMRDGSMTLSDDDQPQVVSVIYASPNTFEVLGAAPVLGRTFTEADAAAENTFAVISDGLWKTRYGGRPDVIGETIRLNQYVMEIAGVMPPDFVVPRGDIDVWVPSDFESPTHHRQTRALNVFGRLQQGVTPVQAATDLDVIQRRIAEDFPEANEGWTVDVVPIADEVVGASTRSLFLLLLGAVGFVLLIACANVANLLLGRSTSRQREISVRTALGASRKRVVSQLLTESGVLALMGAVAGMGLAWVGVNVLVSLDPQGLPRLREVGVEGASLAFALGASVLTALVFGLVPALHAVRGSVADTLKSATGTGGGSSERTRSALVVAEVAVSLVLLVGAGLLMRSLLALGSVDPGFETENVAVARVSLGGQNYRSHEAKVAYFDEMLRRLREIPGVEAAGLTSTLPMDPAGIDFDLPYLAEGQPARPEGELPQTDYRIASAGYFEALGIETVRGRTFNQLDDAAGARVLVINESFAEQLWPGQDAVGKTITIYYVEDTPWEVVGVVRDTRHGGLGAPAPAQMFVPMPQAQFLFTYMHFAVKTTRTDPTLPAAMRRVGVEVDPAYPLYELATLDQIVAATTQRDRFVATLLGTFALLALALAAVGIHGVVAYQVAQRTREIGLRMALGADRRRVLRGVVGRAAAMAGGGVLLGAVGAAAATRAVRGFLYEVSPVDPLTFAAVGALLMAVACFAAFLPALRASRMDPAGALRVD